MKIKIISDEHKFTIPFPNGLILNGFVMGKLADKIKEKSEFDVNISKEQLKILCRELKKTKKLLKGEPLIYVKSGDGDEVKITM